jgi:hypothetical protein
MRRSPAAAPRRARVACPLPAEPADRVTENGAGGTSRRHPSGNNTWDWPNNNLGSVPILAQRTWDRPLPTSPRCASAAPWPVRESPSCSRRLAPRACWHSSVRPSGNRCPLGSAAVPHGGRVGLSSRSNIQPPGKTGAGPAPLPTKPEPSMPMRTDDTSARLRSPLYTYLHKPAGSPPRDTRPLGQNQPKVSRTTTWGLFPSKNGKLFLARSRPSFAASRKPSYCTRHATPLKAQNRCPPGPQPAGCRQALIPHSQAPAYERKERRRTRKSKVARPCGQELLLSKRWHTHGPTGYT